MANYSVSDSNLTAIANAIRTKGGTSASLSFPDGFVNAIGNIPSGSGPTLITKSITTNGTYDASNDSADGYSEVVVNVTSVPSVVIGTFQASSAEIGTSKTISLSYTGNGYPIVGFIYPSAGALAGDMATLAQSRAIIMYAFSKHVVNTTPNYTSNVDDSKAVSFLAMKNSNSDSTAISTTCSPQNWIYQATGNASAYSDSVVRINSSTQMKVFIADTSYGFKDGIEYTYHIVYSS